MKKLAKRILFVAFAGVTFTTPEPPAGVNYPLKFMNAAAEETSPHWRLVRTPGSKDGRDVVSIMRTAETLRSDPDFAGLMIRCSDKALLQIGIVLIQPLPPRESPDVAIAAAGETRRFKGTPLPTGAILALPDTAASLPESSWKKAGEIAVSVQSKTSSIQGVVKTDGLAAALASLRSNCEGR